MRDAKPNRASARGIRRTAAGARISITPGAAPDGSGRSASGAGLLRFDPDRFLGERTAIIERELAVAAAESYGPAARLHEAMRYSLLGGGKRLRPILATAACEAVGGRLDAVINFACAIEMIHTYSMIHDDLPCMDDDDLRRGRPTSHRVYGDAIAILAGDALLTDAFQIASRPVAAVDPCTAMESVRELAEAAGSAGMVGGQVIDLLAEGKSFDLEQLEYLHGRKTGALFVAAARGGARLGGANQSQLSALTDYARAVGLAFQVVDDLLDVESSSTEMGKRTQKDEGRGKATYPSVIGVAGSRALARRLERQALEALRSFDDRAGPLRLLARFAVERKA